MIEDFHGKFEGVGLSIFLIPTSILSISDRENQEKTNRTYLYL